MLAEADFAAQKLRRLLDWRPDPHVQGIKTRGGGEPTEEEISARLQIVRVRCAPMRRDPPPRLKSRGCRGGGSRVGAEPFRRARRRFGTRVVEHELDWATIHDDVISAAKQR